MRVRSIDGDNDWNFGKGRNDYVVNNDCIQQNIKTRLQSFLGDCFFASNDGIDWFSLLGAKDRVALELAVRTKILDTTGVTKIISFTITYQTETRTLLMEYTVETVYTRSQLPYVSPIMDAILVTEDGDVLTTEDGDSIGLG